MGTTVTLGTVILLIVGSAIGLVARAVWERWLAKSSRITPDTCKLNQNNCSIRVVEELRSFKERIEKVLGIQDDKVEEGENEISAIRTKVQRLNALMETSVELQLEQCQTTPGINCTDYVRRLVKLGLSFDKANGKAKLNEQS